VGNLLGLDEGVRVSARLWWVCMGLGVVTFVP